MEIELKHHSDGRTAIATTPSEAVQLYAEGFRGASAPVDASPSESWTHAQLDDAALAAGVDLSGAKSKAEKVAAIEAGPVADAPA